MKKEQYERATEILDSIKKLKDLHDKISTQRIDYEREFPELAEKYRISLMEKVNSEMKNLEIELDKL